MNTAILSSTFEKKKVLVTGGAGFVGSNVVRRLLALGATVTVVDSQDPTLGGNPYNLYDILPKIHLITANMNCEAEMRLVLPYQDYLFNLAGQVSHLESIEDPLTDLEINTINQIALLELCRKWNPQVRIVYAGTRQMYGRPQYLPVDEQHPLQPVDFNGINKMAGEWYHLFCQQVYGLRTTSLRMTNVYGPRMRVRDARKTFVGIWFKQLIEGKEISIYGTGKQVRDFTFVDDAVEAMLELACSPNSEGRVYNLGAQPISLLDLAQLMIRVNGQGSYRFKPFPPERKRIDIGDYFGDCSRIRAETGWQARVSLPEGIERTLDFYRSNKTHYFK